MSGGAVNRFSPEQLRLVQANTFVQSIDFHSQLGSTNDRAIDLAGNADANYPLLVLTESQTAGRGRGTNTWWSNAGALAFSVVLATDEIHLPMESWPQVSLTSGLAVCETLEEILSRGVPAQSMSSLPQVQLKWPNDVYIGGQKICGILVEAPPTAPGKLILGIGLNVNNSLAEAPPELQSTATSLHDLMGSDFSLADVLTLVLQSLAERLSAIEFWNESLRVGWRKRCYLTGKQIQIDNGARKAVGLCCGIDDTGALLLDVDGQMEKHMAGVITVR